MANRSCSVDGCSKTPDARGLCKLHYRRARKAGSLPPKRIDLPLYRINPHTGCWEWERGHSDTGYGTHSVNGRSVLAHRWIVELYSGPIPDGMHVDHLCRNRGCMNPAHLEVVTPRVNIVERGGNSMSAVHARQTHCVNGHPFDEANTYRPPSRPHTRQCRACARERDAKRSRSRRRAA